MFRNHYRNESASERKYRLLSEAVPFGYTMGKNVSSKSLRAGMKVLGYYNSTNVGVDVMEILGFTGHEGEYGKGGVKFHSAKELLAAYHVKTFAQLEDLQRLNEYPHHSYMVVRDIDYTPSDKLSIDTDRQGPWYYLFDGRWSRGSGAEAMSFVELLPINDCPVQKDFDRTILTLED